MTRTLKVRAAAVATVAVATLAGCSQAKHATSSGYASPQALCTALGQTFTEATDEHTLYSSDEGTCGAFTVSWFASRSQRDAWVSAATQFGGDYVVGPAWVVSVDDPASARQVQSVVGGVVK